MFQGQLGLEFLAGQPWREELTCFVITKYTNESTTALDCVSMVTILVVSRRAHVSERCHAARGI